LNLIQALAQHAGRPLGVKPLLLGSKNIMVWLSSNYYNCFVVVVFI